MAGPIEKVLTIFGDIKVFRWPFFVLYDPGSYRVKGEAMREAMNLVRPGDILVRGYLNYLDGYFIPGYFSHAGLYLGEVTPEHIPGEKLELARKGFRTGEQMVIHSMAEGIFMEDFLNFMRCDFVGVLRFPAQLRKVDGLSRISIAPEKYLPAEAALSERLERGETVPFAEAFPVMREAALALLGQPYDFRFDFNDFAQLSCSEFVYFCTKCLAPAVNMRAIEKRVAWLRKMVVEPDQFVSCPQLEVAWMSPSVDPRKLAALRSSAPAAEPAAPLALAG